MHWAYVTVVCIALIPVTVSAQVVITEIMYDLAEGSDSGREWIEVHNISSGTIDLSKWKVVENGKNHKISIVQGSFDSGAYAVIADNAVKFKDDHPGYSGALFDSAFSLNNDGEDIALFDASGKEAYTISYTESMGGGGTGDSLQKTDSGLMPGMPTPGAGVPVGGLMPAPQAAKVSKKPRQNAATHAVAVQPKVVGEVLEPRSHVAMVIASDTPRALLWWLGAAAIATSSAFGISYARRVGRYEWDIIEETGEAS